MRSVLIFHTVTAVGKLDNIHSGFHTVDRMGGGKIVFVAGIQFFETKTWTLNNIQVSWGGEGGREGGTFNLSGNEKSTIISAAKMMQLCKQKLYRYINQNDNDDKK